MKKMSGYLFYIAALCFYVTAAVTFFTSHDGSLVTVWICIGTVFVVLGAGRAKKK